MTKRPRKLWHNILFMTLTPAAALVLTPLCVYFYGFHWGHLVLLLVTYTISNMSITSGYHRYFAHRSYDVHPIVDFLYVLFGAGAFQGSVLAWSTDHRRHHREVDSHGDPYSINKGFWYAHLTWMFVEDQHPDALKYPADLLKNRWVVLQHHYYGWIAAFMGFVLPGIAAWACGLGFWSGVIIGGAVRITLSQHSTFLINSAAHTFGSRPYSDTHSARDNFFLAFLTFGEGYHNFHHQFQADYRNGVRWYQWDPTKWWIRFLALIGFASRLRKTRNEMIFKARLSMDERLMLARGVREETLRNLRARMQEAEIKLKHLQEDYRAAKATFRARGAEMRKDWAQFKRRKKEEFRLARLEFSNAYAEWRACQRMVLRTT